MRVIPRIYYKYAGITKRPSRTKSHFEVQLHTDEVDNSSFPMLVRLLRRFAAQCVRYAKGMYRYKDDRSTWLHLRHIKDGVAS